MASGYSEPPPSYDEVVNWGRGDLMSTSERPEAATSGPTQSSSPPSYELQTLWKHEAAMQGDDSNAQDESTFNLANFYRQAGNYDKALKYYLILYDIRLQIFESISQSKKMSSVMHLIGFCLLRLEQHQESLEWTRRAITIKESQPTLDLAVSYSNYALALGKTKQYKEALKHYKKALKIKNNLISGDAETKAGTLYNIGVLYREGISNYTKSLDYLNKSLAMYRNLLGTECSHINIANCLYDIAVTHYGRKDYSLARKHFGLSLTQFQELHPSEPYHGDIERTICGLGNVHYCLRDYYFAEISYKTLVSIRKAKYSRQGNCDKLLSAYRNLIITLQAQDKITEACDVDKLRNKLLSYYAQRQPALS